MADTVTPGHTGPSSSSTAPAPFLDHPDPHPPRPLPFIVDDFPIASNPHLHPEWPGSQSAKWMDSSSNNINSRLRTLLKMHQMCVYQSSRTSCNYREQLRQCAKQCGSGGRPEGAGGEKHQQECCEGVFKKWSWDDN